MKPFIGVANEATAIEKEWQARYCQASLEYGMERSPIKQIGLGRALAAIRRDRVSGLTDVAKHLESQDCTVITIPETWNDLVHGAKTHAPFQRSDNRPSDKVWNMMVDNWDKSAATLPLHEGEFLIGNTSTIGMAC